MSPPSPLPTTLGSPVDDVRAAALRHHELGRVVVILPPRTKQIQEKGWPERRYTPEELSQLKPNVNLGLLLVAESGLVDVDVDCKEALALAPVFLPLTDMRHGHPSNPESHYWFAASPHPAQVKRFEDPVATRTEPAGAVIVELRSGSKGHAAQTMIPPSIHPSGERLEWSGGGLDAEPAHVAAAVLRRQVGLLAASALFVRHYPAPGSRHQFALAVAGLLIRGAMPEDDAIRFVGAIARAAGDEEVEDRERAVTDTATRVASGEPVTSGPRLAEVIGAGGELIVAAAHKWLGLSTSAPRASSAVDSTRAPCATTGTRAGHTRPQIVVNTDESAVVDAAIAALACAPEIYSQGGEIVEVITDDPKTRGVTRSGPLARIQCAAEARVRELLAREAQWLAPGHHDALVPVHPPQWAVRAVMARGHWPALRPLVAVVEAPTMRPDGTILSTPGHDPTTGIYLAPGVALSIPECPTRDDAIAAAKELSDVIADFPVATPAGRSAWLAGVLTVVIRPAIEGPTPIIIVDASMRGAGKTLMADAAAMIATGRPAARHAYVADDSEMRKQITALALSGDPFALLDNIVGTVGCPALDAALTGTTWRDRLLGSSQMTADLPLRIVFWATGNRLVMGADLARRALLVRLEPMTEHPEERSVWRYPRLLDHVRDARDRLLTAALVIGRAYVVAGRPDQRLTPMGSYTAWSDLVRSALVWAALPDPYITIADIRACDARADEFRRVVEEWPVPEGKRITVTSLLDLARPDSQWRAALVDWCPPRGGEVLPTARDLGNRLRSVRRQVVVGKCLDTGERGRDGMTWLVQRVTA